MSVFVYSQVIPAKDKNWRIDSLRSDEFDNTEIDNTKWKAVDDSKGKTGWTTGNFVPENVLFVNDSLNNGYLRLRAQNKYSTACVQSNEENYFYGFYEIRAKLPGFYDTILNRHSNRGFWTAFWTYHAISDKNLQFPHNRLEHCEIDILEPCGRERDLEDGSVVHEDDAQTYEVGYHLLKEDTISKQPDKIDYHIIQNLPPLYENFHKYAVEFLPYKLIYYFDDSIVYTTTKNCDTSRWLNHDMRVVLGNQLQHDSVVYTYRPFPNDYDIDYFRYYTMDFSNCDNDITIANNQEMSEFAFGVWKNIYIGNSQSSIDISDDTILRINNSVELNAIEIAIGNDFEIIFTKCE